MPSGAPNAARRRRARWAVANSAAFVASAVDSNVVFRLGYNHVLGGIDRVTLWEQRESLRGKLVKYKHQPGGAKEAPRFPKFVGFREAWDL